MRVSTPTAVPLLGLLVVGPAFAYPQESNSAVQMRTAVSPVVPVGAVVDEITFVGSNALSRKRQNRNSLFIPEKALTQRELRQIFAP